MMMVRERGEDGGVGLGQKSNLEQVSFESSFKKLEIQVESVPALGGGVAERMKALPPLGAEAGRGTSEVDGGGSKGAGRSGNVEVRQIRRGHVVNSLDGERSVSVNGAEAPTGSQAARWMIRGWPWGRGFQADELTQLTKEVHFHTSAHLLEGSHVFYFDTFASDVTFGPREWWTS